MDQEGAALQARLQGAVTNAMSQVEVKKIRPMQRKAYLCMAGCMESSSTSEQTVKHCLDNCSGVVNTVNQLVQNEMNSLQGRIQRCSMDCQDEFNDKLTHEIRENPVKLEAAKKRSMMCVTSCVDKHIDLLKSITKKLENDIDRAQQSR
mmetsp:Transcript_28297/g.28591  ORF Transcript_28297/g.28591 Transcript_28297/m.28591 type:complete len:149 (-) Transcript_28297:108-554(-)